MPWSQVAASLGHSSSHLLLSYGLYDVGTRTSLPGPLLYLGVCFLPLCAVSYAFYRVFTIPLRRASATRFLLDVIGAALKQGADLAGAIRACEGSKCDIRPSFLGSVASRLESGEPITEALRARGSPVPDRITEMLRAGEKSGDLGAVLPACRRALDDTVSNAHSGHSYLALLPALLYLPVAVFVPFILAGLPGLQPAFGGDLRRGYLGRLGEVAADCGADVEATIAWSRSATFAWALVAAVFWGLVLLVWVGKCRRRPVSLLGLGRVAGRLQWRLPWSRRRMQRDFSAVLAILLDTGMREQEAIALASRCTGNLIFEQRAAGSARRLERGEPLAEALGSLDASGELEWRLTNAARSKAGFGAALAGWHDALEAKAFQQEQAASHLLTTGFVLLNGALICSIAFGVFGIMIRILEEALLW